MRQLLLTGLATEQPFFPANNQAVGSAKYFLLFNDGEFRIEVSEKAAESCIQKMFGDAQEPSPSETDEASDEYEYARDEDDAAVTDEDGVGQV